MPRHPPCALLSLTYSVLVLRTRQEIMLRISLGSLGDEYMPCSSTYIHLLLTIISLQLSASLFFLYSVLKVHACGGHVAFFSGISANCSLAVIPSRKSLAVCHVAPRAITVPSHSPWFATCRGASRWWAQWWTGFLLKTSKSNCRL